MNINSHSLIHDLPSLPEALLHIVETLHQDETGLQDLANIIQRDAALTLRLMAVANSGKYGRALASASLRQSIIRLGMSSVRSIVLAMVFRQFVDGFKGLPREYLRAFWWRSLTSAHFARRLAKLVGYANLDEAFLAGLLMNCGELVLASYAPAEVRLDAEEADSDQLAREKKLFGTTHPRLGGDIALHSGLSPYLADALCFHHESMENLRDAHQLVKIVALSSEAIRLRGGADEGWTISDGLFGLNQSLLREMLAATREEVGQLASALNLQGDEASQQRDVIRLQELLGMIGEASQATRELWAIRGPAEFEQGAQRCLALLMPVRKVMLFLLDHAGGTLEGGYGESGGMPTIAVNIAGSNSQLVDAFRQRAVRPIVHGGGSVLDQQLIRRVEPDHCYAVPLVHDRRTVGVLALGVSGGQPFPGAGKAFLFDLLRQQIADALQNLREATTTGGAAAPDDDLRQQLREAIHEASNPLSIIRNYLDVLRMRIGDQALACSEIALIGEEIDRIGSILLRLRETGDDSASEKLQDISEVIGGVADIFRTTLCATRRVELSVDLPSRALVVRTRVGHLKQVLVNLLKNAVEALPEGGSIGLSAASVYAESGTRWVEITVSDDGPGLPDPVMMQLFQPMKSTKGEGHSGLGLSITKKLIDQLGGRLTCKTGTSGTRFQVLLPSSETVQS